MGDRVDPITVSVIQHRLEAIVQEMGEAMLRTSYSQILNSSRDFSTALCDAEGRLVAQAEHVPIHVGAIPWAVRSVQEFFGDRVRPGDVYLLNDPYHGNNHLPDLTAFVPVFALEAQEGRLFKPLAWTKTLAMASASLLSITVVPVAMGLFIRGRIRPEHDHPVSRALVMQPSLLLADEPTGDLDEATADSLHQLLRDMHHEFGLTAIIATHNPRLASQCDRTLRLEAGRLL